LFDPAPTEMNWRSVLGAWYAEDVIRLKPSLTLSLGFRDEFTTGWNETHGRAANYFYTNGVINSAPHIGGSEFLANNAKFLPQPRIGIAWSRWQKNGAPSRIRHVQRLAGCAGISRGPKCAVQSNIQHPEFRRSNFPIDPSAPVPATAKLVPAECSRT